jgi:hypothetical protein
VIKTNSTTRVTRPSNRKEWALDVAALEDVVVKAVRGKRQVKFVGRNGCAAVTGCASHGNTIAGRLAISTGGVNITKTITRAGIHSNTTVVKRKGVVVVAGGNRGAVCGVESNGIK